MWIPHSFALTIQPLTPCNDIIQYAAYPARPYHLGSFETPKQSSFQLRCHGHVKRLFGLVGNQQSSMSFPVLLEKNLLLGSLLGGVATQLPLGLGLHGALGSADGGGTGNSGLTEVRAVSGLGGGRGNVLEGPV